MNELPQKGVEHEKQIEEMNGYIYF